VEDQKVHERRRKIPEIREEGCRVSIYKKFPNYEEAGYNKKGHKTKILS
jgi:hypothetical protein